MSTCPGCENCIFDNPYIPIDAHEIHITVKDADVDAFKRACQLLEMKPVLIAMQGDGGTFHHLMTSKTMRGDAQDVLSQAKLDAELMRLGGFEVVRTKIETVLTNPMCRNRQSGSYFESHIELQFTPDQWEAVPYSVVESIVKIISPKLLLSRNVFKKTSEMVSIFVTYRDTNPETTVYDFSLAIKNIVDWLTDYFKIGKVRSEFAWYDSSIEQDKDWK